MNKLESEAVVKDQIRSELWKQCVASKNCTHARLLIPTELGNCLQLRDCVDGLESEPVMLL